MKVKNILSLVILFALCSGALQAQTTKEKRTASEFDGVTVSHNINVIYTQNNDYSIEVEANSGIMNAVETFVSEKTLTVKIKDNYNFKPNDRVLVYISAPSLARIKTSGSSKFTASKVNSTQDISLNTSGGSNIEIDTLSAKNLTSQTSGGARISIDQSTAENCDISTSGGSNVRIGNNSSNITTNSSGGSHITVNGKTKNIVVNGSGGSVINIKDLTYETVTAKCSGGSRLAK